MREYPLAESVIVYGGEEADPPKFGTVYVGIKPREGLFISSSIKEGIKNLQSVYEFRRNSLIWTSIALTIDANQHGSPSPILRY